MRYVCDCPKTVSGCSCDACPSATIGGPVSNFFSHPIRVCIYDIVNGMFAKKKINKSKLGNVSDVQETEDPFRKTFNYLGIGNRELGVVQCTSGITKWESSERRLLAWRELVSSGYSSCRQGEMWEKGVRLNLLGMPDIEYAGLNKYLISGLCPLSWETALWICLTIYNELNGLYCSAQRQCLHALLS